MSDYGAIMREMELKYHKPQTRVEEGEYPKFDTPEEVKLPEIYKVKQRKISDPDDKTFHEILDKVTNSKYREQMRMVKYIADDIMNKVDKFILKDEINDNEGKIQDITKLLHDKGIETKLGIDKDDVTVLKKFMKKKLDIINEFILQNAPSDLNVDDDDDDDMEGGKRKKHRRSRKKTSHKRKTKKQKTKRRKRTTIRKKK